MRYRNREAVLRRDAARHYLKTITFRSECFDITRLSDEVVLASAQDGLLLSHPQSEFWLDARTVSHLIRAAGGETQVDLPEWIAASTAGGRLLLSDGRNGRWVLLAADHIREFERRADGLNRSSTLTAAPRSPRIAIKGVTVRLQSAFDLRRAMESLAETADFEPFEHRGPDFFLRAARATEGMAVMDSAARTAITSREARKWAAIIQGEIDKFNARETRRGSIRTIFADVADGRWVLQWGDEIFIREPTLARLRSGEAAIDDSGLASRREGDYLLLLDQRTGSCVALDESQERL